MFHPHALSILTYYLDLPDVEGELGVIIAKVFATLGDEVRVEALKQRINLDKSDEQLVDAMVLRARGNLGKSTWHDNRTQPITIGQHFLSNPCPIAAIGTTRTTMQEIKIKINGCWGGMGVGMIELHYTLHYMRRVQDL